MFASVEEVQERLREQRYIATAASRPSSSWPSRMNKPILVEGPAGVGKTELAKVLAGRSGGR